VQFFDGNIALGGPVPVTGSFAFLFTTLPKGSHSLTAVFSPADGFAPSTSAAVSLTVNSLF
jgi:hypothetical protein